MFAVKDLKKLQRFIANVLHIMEPAYRDIAYISRTIVESTGFGIRHKFCHSCPALIIFVPNIILEFILIGMRMYLPHSTWFYCYESCCYSFAGRKIATVKNLNGSSVTFDWRYLAKLMLVLYERGTFPVGESTVWDSRVPGSPLSVIYTSFLGMFLKVSSGTPKFADRRSMGMWANSSEIEKVLCSE